MTLPSANRSDRQPAVPSEFKDILSKIVVQGLLDGVRDFVNKRYPEVTKDQDRKLNDDIAVVQEKGSFAGFSVIEATVDNITIYMEFPEITIPGLPAFKLSHVTVAFTIKRFINLIDESKPTIIFESMPYFFTVEAAFNRDNYGVAIAGGVNTRAGISFNQYRAEIKWKEPTFYLRAFMASSDQGGFLLDVNGIMPFAIPLGPTGMGMNGIGLIYGEQFAPKLDNFTNNENAISRMEQFTAQNYVDWSKSYDLDKWIAVKNSTLRVFGISTTIVEMATCGKLIRVSGSGITYLSFGPTIILGGSVAILDTIEVGAVIGAIDIRSRTLFMRAVQSFPLIPRYPDAVKLEGSLVLSASLKNSSETWIAIGGKAMDGCKVEILGLLKLIGGVRLVPFQGAAARASARMEGGGKVLGFGGGFSFWIELAASLGWNPIEIGGSLEVGGGIWVKIIGQKIGLGVSAKLAIQLPAPLLLEFVANVEVDLPWPMGDIRFPVQIFNYNKPTPQKPAAPLKLAASEQLAFVHGPSGTLGGITDAVQEVWPDVNFVIPMQRVAGSSTLILNRRINDGFFNEAGVSVQHHFTVLKIEKIDIQTGTAVIVPEVRACWLFTANGSMSERTSQLAIPCVDPLNWVNSFDYAQPNTSQSVERLVFQTFGLGSSELVTGHPASRRFESVVVKSRRKFWIQLMPWSMGYERGILSERIQIEFSVKASSGRFPVKWCDIRIILPFDEEPLLKVTNGTLENICLVRHVGDAFKECSFIISRDKSEYALDLEIGNGERSLQIAAIGYLIDTLADIENPPFSVFTPGNYRLSVAGKSSAIYKSNAAPDTIWDTIVRDFTVINPPLRPYLRYSTLGDERIFGLEAGGWNPNPKGIGFGHYLDHLGLVRSRVGYLSKIYPQLWVSPQQDTPAFEVQFKLCEEGTLEGSKVSQEWLLAIGGTPLNEEEFTFEVAQVPGINTIRVFYQQPNGTADLAIMVDEWSYRVSAYRNASDHLYPKAKGLHYAYGPFGHMLVTPGLQPSLPAGFDIKVLPEAGLRNGWGLPAFVDSLLGLADPQTGLRFLHCLDWAGVFGADPAMPGAGVLSRPQETDLNLVFDKGTAPMGFLLRTDEPCDWRRVVFMLATSADGNFAERLDVRLCPAPDGCSCLLVAKAKGIPVRLPKGDYVLYARYCLEAPNLPRLTERMDHRKKVEEFYFTFSQPFGKSW